MSVFDTYAEQRRAESLAQHELDNLQASTDAIQAGISNGGLWLLLVGGIAVAPFTAGISLLVTIFAAIAMSGGRHMLTDAAPKTVDIVAPTSGCMRILASLVCLALAIVAVAFVLGLVAFESGVIK